MKPTKKPLLRPGLSTMMQGGGRKDVEDKAGDVRAIMAQGTRAMQPNQAGSLRKILGQ